MRANPARTIACLAAVLALPAEGQVTTLVSRATGGSGNRASFPLGISADGRFVSFLSIASDLVPSDGGLAYIHVFVRDVQLGRTELVDLGPGGVVANDESSLGGMSDDGRFVAFTSFATNLVAGDTNGVPDVFVRDRDAGITERMSVSSSGAQGDLWSGNWGSTISGDGRFVAFAGDATNLVPGDTNGRADVFVHDRGTRTTERVSVDSSGGQGDFDSRYPALSFDGRFVVFTTYADNLVPGDTNAHLDVMLHDRQTAITERVSVDSAGVQGNGDSYTGGCSADGRFVAFYSDSTNLVPGDTNGALDVFVRDRLAGTTERVSVSSSGGEGNDVSWGAWISSDSRFVVFASRSSNLVPGDTNNELDAFLYDRQTRTTERVSLTTSGAQGNGASGGVAASANARFVLLSSDATNFAAGDANGATDVFVRDRAAASFTSLCDPGQAGVIGCPCSNPPGGAGQGCDNSAGTGGASLAASGSAYLSSDALVFHSSGEPATALSIVLQGSAPVPSGLVYGRGVRCLGGSLERLYTRTASNGAIDAPDLTAGDPTVSARSAALGSAIAPGESRYYLVYYRDPTVSGGCPPTSDFNSTLTGAVLWFP